MRVQAAELGLSIERPLTVTGGMTFGGGPLNNYVLQSTAAMVDQLRRDPGAVGLVTAVSGMITKQGVSIWSTRPPAEGYRSDDVTDAVAAEMPVVESVIPADEEGVVASYTVLYADGLPAKGVVLVDRVTKGRSIAVSQDPQVLAAMTTEEWCGRKVALREDATFTPM